MGIKANKIKGLKINTNNLLTKIIIFLEILPFVNVTGLNYISPVLYNLLFNYYRKLCLIVLAFCFIAVLVLRKLQKRDLKLYFVLLIPLYVLIVSLHYGGEISTWYYNYIMIIVAFLIVYLNIKKLPCLLEVLLFILEVLLVANLITIIIYPNGLYYNSETKYTLNWLLGYKSSLQYFVLPALCFRWIVSNKKNNIAHFWLLYFLCVIESLLTQNSMLIIGDIIFIVCYLLKSKKGKIFSDVVLNAVVIGTNLALILANQVLANLSWWQSILLALGKNSTLTTRTRVWLRVIDAIQDNALLGHGVMTNAERIYINGGFSGANHAHNQALEFLFVGGVVLLVIFVAYNIILNKALLERSGINTGTSTAFMVSIFTLYIMVTVEVFTTINGFSIWIVLILPLLCDRIDEQYGYPD